MEYGCVLSWPHDPMRKQDLHVLRLAAMDPREAPMYSAADIALYTGVPPSTLRYWLNGTKDDPIPLVVAPGPEFERRRLSFSNLLEAHLLLATRKKNIPLTRIRRGVSTLRDKYPGADHPLLDYARQLRYAENRRDLLLMEDGSSDPINLSKGGQSAFGPFFSQYLHRIEWDDSGPVRLTPIRSNRITIDVNIAGGQPVVKGTGILAHMLLGRHRGGESIRELASDYKLRAADVKEAIRYLEAA
jgi:uncharacterized protein (DUF433 family)